MIVKKSSAVTQMHSTDWDTIVSSSLLHLTGFRRTADEFGFLLRHYWMPETVLTYESEASQWILNAPIVEHVERISRRLLKSDVDTCTWREKATAEPRDELVRLSPSPMDRICTYNRSAQTFTIRKNPFEADGGERTHAFLMQPILTPLLPIPLGFCWHVSSKDGYMEFTLESKTVIGEMPVLMIRRRGRFSLNAFFQGGSLYEGRLVVEREGVTAYALHRCVVLEDRTRDIIVEAEKSSRLAGMETKTILKLVESSLSD